MRASSKSSSRLKALINVPDRRRRRSMVDVAEKKNPALLQPAMII